MGRGQVVGKLEAMVKVSPNEKPIVGFLGTDRTKEKRKKTSLGERSNWWRAKTHNVLKRLAENRIIVKEKNTITHFNTE